MNDVSSMLKLSHINGCCIISSGCCLKSKDTTWLLILFLLTTEEMSKCVTRNKIKDKRALCKNELNLWVNREITYEISWDLHMINLDKKTDEITKLFFVCLLSWE